MMISSQMYCDIVIFYLYYYLYIYTLDILCYAIARSVVLISVFSDFERTYHVFSRFIEDEFPDWLAQIFDYIASPAVIIPLFLLLM